MDLYKTDNFERISGRSSQGNVGYCTIDGKRKVWKTSRRHDFTLEAEYEVSTAISGSCLGILPHFCKVTHLTSCICSPSDNIKQSCILMTKISGGRFSDVLRNRCTESKDTLCILRQIMVSLLVAQKALEFTHYDLHVENILVRQTNFDLHIYITQDGKVYPVETHGLCPVIIDYGYTYVNKYTTLLPSLYFNSSGFCPYKADPLRDVFTLLCSVNAEVKDPNSRLLAETMNLFTPIMSKNYGLEWEHGWLTGLASAKRTFAQVLRVKDKNIRSDSIILDTSMIADLLQALIPPSLVLPSQHWGHLFPDLSGHEVPYQQAALEFYFEWFQVEEELNNFGLEALFMKLLIQAIRQDTVSQVESDVSRYFMRDFDVNYQTLMRNLILMADKLTLAIREIAAKDTKRLSTIYSKLEVSNMADVLERLESSVFPPTIYGRDKVIIYDLREGGSVRRLHLTNDQIRKLNTGLITIESVVL